MRTKSGRGDVLLVCMVLFLVVFGLAVLYSTGSYNGSVRFGDAFYYMKKQFFAAALGMLAMYLISCMDYHIFEKYAIAAYLISLALSTLVLFAGNAYNGSRRWLSLGPLSFQPSEFAKLAVILFLARMVGRQKKKRNSFLNLVFVIALVLPIVALVGTNNLSTAIIILGIAVIVVFVSDKRYMQFVWIAAGAMGHIAIQVILNVAVVTNTIPNTGITLPFISYGGTSVLFLLSEMGLVLAVSRWQSEKKCI